MYAERFFLLNIDLYLREGQCLIDLVSASGGICKKVENKFTTFVYW